MNTDGGVGERGELTREQSWPCTGPAELELLVDVGPVRVELASGPDEAAAGLGATGPGDTGQGDIGPDAPGQGATGQGTVRVEVRHDPAAGPGWVQGLTGLISWLGSTGPFQAPARDPAALACDAVAATEISWTAASRRLVVRSPEELPLRMVPLVVTVHAPASSRVTARTTAGDVTVTGPAGRSDVTSGSGDIMLDAVEGPSRMRTGSGQVDLGATTGRTDIRTGSGDVRVGAFDGELRVRAGSGDVTVSDARSGSLELATGSGRLTVAVHPGVSAELDLSSGSGSARSELELAHVAPAAAPALRVRGRTGSGDVLVTRALPV